MGDINSEINKVAGILKQARRILFITGAGISAESGLPTYRGVAGLYNDRATRDGIPIEMALAGETLARKPEITWKYLSQIETRCRGAKFNRAHEIIAEMEKHFDYILVFTQNIDGFHRDAGSKNVIDIHGDIHDIYCPKCGWRIKVKDYSQIQIPPRCPECRGIARPDVVFFGEMLEAGKIGRLMKDIADFDVYFSVGTTSVFPYIQQPIAMAKRAGKVTIEINPSDTEISHLVDIKIRLGAAEALSKIWQQARG